MVATHILGFPRIGNQRQAKIALEKYWAGNLELESLLEVGKAIRQQNWTWQKQSGLDFITVGDFSWYDHVLDTALMLGVVPQRFNAPNSQSDINTMFQMARGQAPLSASVTPCAMTKWFNSNYHYLVPELDVQQNFSLSNTKLLDEICEAQKYEHPIKAVCLGPLSFLWLAKARDPKMDKLTLLPAILIVYHQLLEKLAQLNIGWLQIDEPILCLNLTPNWQEALVNAYENLNGRNIKLLLTTYFDSLAENTLLAMQLPTAGIHIDFTYPQDLDCILENCTDKKIVSCGMVNGRTIWRCDHSKALATLGKLYNSLKERLWLAGSCSFIHLPVDLAQENQMDKQLKSKMAFAKQKLTEIIDLKKALIAGNNRDQEELTAIRTEGEMPNQWSLKNQEVQLKRSSPYSKRRLKQQEKLALPILATTTIGSFPQTTEMRQCRRAYQEQKISLKDYEEYIKEQIKAVIALQEKLGLDVLVHGESERNDMVEYFAQELQGFAFTEHGWVQSYGSRYVKPPIIYQDIKRTHGITIKWIKYAQSLTEKPVKGMLTGPLTLLLWSFFREDIPWQQTLLQLSFALREEVLELEKHGVKIIQIDEPAFREGLPLQQSKWKAYLDIAIKSFRMATSSVKDETQIHTHMCYSKFNDIIEAIAQLDADVITIESARSQMQLLEAFAEYDYPNEMGPGVFDSHSPSVPTVDSIANLIEQAAQVIDMDKLWVNPDCGLKTRKMDEIIAALANMIEAAKRIREKGK